MFNAQSLQVDLPVLGSITFQGRLLSAFYQEELPSVAGVYLYARQAQGLLGLGQADVRYVGISNDLARRHCEHRSELIYDPAWSGINVIYFHAMSWSTEDHRRMVEALLIECLNPPINKTQYRRPYSLFSVHANPSDGLH